MPNPAPRLENLTNAGKGRPPKDADKVSFRLDAALHKKLENYCTTTKTSKTQAIEMLIRDYLPSAWYEWDLSRSRKKKPKG